MLIDCIFPQAKFDYNLLWIMAVAATTIQAFKKLNSDAVRYSAGVVYCDAINKSTYGIFIGIDRE